MVQTRREKGRGALGEANHVGRDAGKEADMKTANQIKRSAEKRPRASREPPWRPGSIRSRNESASLTQSRF